MGLTRLPGMERKRGGGLEGLGKGGGLCPLLDEVEIVGRADQGEEGGRCAGGGAARW